MVSIVAVIVAAGCLGGMVNYFLTLKTDPERMGPFANLVVGIGAAFLVPLFLNMLSSDLIEKIHPAQGNPDFSKFLVFAGFCLVAAMSSRAFIKTLSERILKEVTEAKQKASAAEEKAVSAEQKAMGAEERASEAKAAVEPIVASNTEQDSNARSLGTEAASLVALDDADKLILDKLAHGKYTLRTRSGLSEDTKLDKPIVDQKMDELKQKGFVSSTKVLNRSGEPRRRWYITPQGREALT